MKKTDAKIDVKNQKTCECASQEEVRHTYRSEAEKRYISGRLNRIAGQMNGIRRMIDEDRYCEEILVQLSAACNALKSLSVYVLEQHSKNCIINQIKDGNDAAIDEVITLVKRFLS